LEAQDTLVLANGTTIICSKTTFDKDSVRYRYASGDTSMKSVPLTQAAYVFYGNGHRRSFVHAFDNMVWNPRERFNMGYLKAQYDWDHRREPRTEAEKRTPTAAISPLVANYPQFFRYFRGPQAFLCDDAFARGYMNRRKMTRTGIIATEAAAGIGVLAVSAAASLVLLVVAVRALNIF
jgi:hypothetical protein